MQRILDRIGKRGPLLRTPTKKIAIGALLVAAGVLTAVTPANATTSSDGWKGELRDWFSSYGVSAETSERLIAEHEAGDPWDSFSGTEPVSERVADNGFSTIHEYADGSITVVSLEPENAPAATGGGFSTQAIGQVKCNRSSGGSGYTYYQECMVGASNGILEIVFHADYTRHRDGASIGRVYSPYAYTVGGSAPTPTLSISKKDATGSARAQAVASTQYKAWNGGSSFTGRLYLDVTRSSATAWTSGY